MFRFSLTMIAVCWIAQPGLAHYNMLLPETNSPKKGDKVGFVYQFGHPFEHELFDAPQPTRLEVRLPDGKIIDLTAKLEKFKKPGGVDGKDVIAFRFDFTPEQRGDHWFILTAAPIWMEESKEFYQDVVQTVLHVQTQNGWTEVPGNPMRLVPLTRPYGILPGMVFRAKLVQPLPGYKPVEIERYNPQRPKEIPPDELVTFTTLPDINGVIGCTLTEPGWWCITARAEFAGKRTLTHDGNDYPVRPRVTLWLHVTTKADAK